MTGLLLNKTEDFYKGGDASLLWEMTICQSLSRADAPCANALETRASYGEKLAGFLTSRAGIKPGARIIEVGCGYGTLMESLIGHLRPSAVTMIDISPRFHEMQKTALGSHKNVSFVLSDVFDWLDTPGETADLLISNENIGDFPAADGLSPEKVRRMLESGITQGDTLEGRSVKLIQRYGLPLPEGDEPFALNIGAIEYLEKLKGRAKTVFLSEHSADIVLREPYSGFLDYDPAGRPRRIELKGHAEYTIRFDHLERVAKALGFKTERVSMLEFLGVRHDAGARFVARAECVGNENAEILHEFLHHVKEYECLLLQL
ncbi:methyltransferase domain-containing protein [bacterium]|nr:MAG: methyltransferase domain-containing protein [bacterium]